MSEGARAGGVAPEPLCVDLDGSLLAGDTLYESLLGCLRSRPGALLRLPLWLLRGRAHLKARLGEACELEPAALPWREDVLAWVREERARGRRIVLATASTERLARAVAAELGCFDEVIASDELHNLKGARKRDALVARFGEGGFEYLGDSAADRPVWRSAARASAVGLDPARLEGMPEVGRRFERPRGGLAAWARGLRLHQWVKNVLVFLPALAAHRFTDVAVLGQAAVAFLAFGLTASAVYVFNDLMDLPSDRAHPSKRRRPFASGRLPLPAGLLASPLLVVAAGALSLSVLPNLFSATLAFYLLLNALYTFGLKRVPIADVLFLASLYALRILAGGFATAIEVSPWLIAFSLFFFLNLAFLKRFADLRILAAAGAEAAAGRGYRVADAPMLLALGPASGYIAAVVLALYVQSAKVATLYRSPVVLWLLVPLLIYWISRIWLLAHRGRMSDDPIIFTTRDPVSYCVLGLAVLVFAAGAVLRVG